jgi:hypothetical protein
MVVIWHFPTGAEENHKKSNHRQSNW